MKYYNWVQYDSEGKIHMVGTSDTIPQPQKPEWQVSEGFATLEMYFDVEGGVAKDRPQVALPDSHDLAVNQDWEMVDVPDQTEVFVDGELVGTTDSSPLVLNFSNTGVWPLTLLPPFPYVKSTCEVNVA